MYVAVKGGEVAIDNAHKLLAKRRRGNKRLPAVSCEQISEQLTLGVARVMAEGSLYDPDMAALALKQARGDTIEAVFLLRAFRNTLQRIGYSKPIDTAKIVIERRISATYKDLPGGQLLGPTFDYTHRLLDPELLNEENDDTDTTCACSNELAGLPSECTSIEADEVIPRVTDLLAKDSMIETDDHEDDDPIDDITRQPLDYPLSRQARLQALARGDEGFLLGLGYSTQRGYGRNHPFAGEIRIGMVSIECEMPELGFSLNLGAIRITECQMINQFSGSKTEQPKFTRGYGLVFGHSERKAMSMALVDRALRADELGEDKLAPAQDEEFVIAHSDNVQATGFVEHLKLPHYVDFQAELELVRRMRAEVAERMKSQLPIETDSGVELQLAETEN